MEEKPRRKRRRVEQRLVWEWVKKNFPDRPQWFRQRVGKAVFVGDEKLYQVLRRWADAIILDDKEIVIVEGKLRPKPEAIAELLLYKSLFPETPEFKVYKDLPIRMIMLTTMLDKAVKALAKQHKIEYVIYAPAWVKVIMRERA